MQPKKSLGQNFLQHPQIAERMVDAARVSTDITILEIGPGTGLLTRVLLEKAYTVVAIEADHSLIPILTEKFSEELANHTLSLIPEDIRTFEISPILGDYAVIANIPYYITGEIIRKFLSASHKPASMTVLVQKEVAERIARPQKGGAGLKESLLSLSVKAYGTPSYCFTVPRGAFFPTPNVDSAVLTIQNIQTDAFASTTEEEAFFTLLHAGFAHKRKLLARNLEEVTSPEAIARAFESLNIPLKIRAEDLTLFQWQTLTSLLSSSLSRTV